MTSSLCGFTQHLEIEREQSKASGSLYPLATSGVEPWHREAAGTGHHKLLNAWPFITLRREGRDPIWDPGLQKPCLHRLQLLPAPGPVPSEYLLLVV